MRSVRIIFFLFVAAMALFCFHAPAYPVDDDFKKTMDEFRKSMKKSEKDSRKKNDAKNIPDFDKYRKFFKKPSGTITIDIDSDINEEDETTKIAKTAIKGTCNRSKHKHVKLDITDAEVEDKEHSDGHHYIKLRGKCKAVGELRVLNDWQVHQAGIGKILQRMEDKTGNAYQCSWNLLTDTKSGTYQFASRIRYNIKTTEKHFNYGYSIDDTKTKNSDSEYGHNPKISPHQVPEGGTLSGTEVREYNGGMFHGCGGHKTKARVAWNIVFEPPDELEAVFDLIPPDDYSNWIPEGGKNEEAKGNDITIRVKLQNKNKPDEPVEQTAKFKFELLDVSKNKGVCTNHPLKGKDSEDLRIRQEDNPKLDVTDYSVAESKDCVTKSEVTVNSYDYAAFGRLKVTAKLDDGRTLTAKTNDGKTELTIPKDDDDNKIADAWEKKEGVSGYSANWDEDPEPAGQRRPGDGYTMFEEYRGFATKETGDMCSDKGRLSPKKKDLFVYDPDGLVRQYYKPSNPAKLNLHYVDPNMIVFNGNGKDPDNRWVNFNSNESDKKTTYARQYALHMVKWTTLSDTLGEANDMVLSDKENRFYDANKAFKQPLKEVYLVKVSIGSIENLAKGVKESFQQDTYHKTITLTVIHEFGHAIGIHHHKGGYIDETEIPEAGVVDCAMRYPQGAEALHGLLREQTRYCQKGETWVKTITKKDKDGNESVEWKTLPSDNCFGQIDIKSDP